MTNFDGTYQLLSLCKEAGLRKLHYVSTAYVCGLREGTIYESDLNCGQSFRNDYEESKMFAESMVRDADYIRELTVYRPAVIAGDSQTGYTNTYHGIYLYLRLMALLVPRQPLGPDGVRLTKLRLPMTGDERRNVVPVDWVSEVMAKLYANSEAHGHTYHLAPDQCLTPREIIDAGYKYFNSTGVEYVGYEPLDPATYNDFEAELLPGFAMYTNYESTDPKFDCTNLKRFAGELVCPVIDEEMLHNYIRFGEQDRWGKRNQSRAKIQSWAADYFGKLDRAEESHKNCKARVALDLAGPGGGQWTLVLLNDGTLFCEPGLDARADRHVGLSTDEFLSQVDRPSSSVHQHALEHFFPLVSGGVMHQTHLVGNSEPAKG